MLSKLFCIIIISLALGVAFHAFAHVEKTNSSISVLIHINPNDSPIAGENSMINFKVINKNGEFEATDCDCVLTINQNENPIFIKKSNDADVIKNKNELSFPYIFPENGKYDIDIEGKPINGADFGEFGFDFETDVVSRKSLIDLFRSHDPASKHLVRFLLFGGAIIISGLVIIFGKSDSK